MRKIVVLIVTFLIIVFTGIILILRNSSKRSSEIHTVRVIRKEFIKTVNSSGKTISKRISDLKFQTSGKLTWVGVTQGDHVVAGQIIAKLDSREVEKNLKNALLDYAKTRNDFEETWRVTYNGISNPNAALTDSIKRILQKNQWNLDLSVNDVEIQSLALEYATLTTPISGIVTSIDVPIAGVNITPATAVFTVIDPGSVVFNANIDETDVGSLTLNSLASISLDAYPDATFSGKISYISYSSIISAGGATVFPVEITIDNPGNLRIGLNGDVTIHTINIPDAITVPLEAIREQESGKYVYRKSGTTYEKVLVSTGNQNDSDCIITDGLSIGDVVVVKGFSAISK